MAKQEQGSQIASSTADLPMADSCLFLVVGSQTEGAGGTPGSQGGAASQDAPGNDAKKEKTKAIPPSPFQTSP